MTRDLAPRIEVPCSDARDRLPAIRMKQTVTIACALAVTALLHACGGPSGPGSRTALDVRVDDETYADARRLYLVLADDDERREETRLRLLEYLATRTDGLVTEGEYDPMVSHFAEMTSLLAPRDLAEGQRVSELIAPVARWIVEHGSRRGDEPRVLAALLILARIEPADASHAQEYARVAEWGREARWGREPRPSPDFFDLAPELIAVWEEHARLSPSPDVLARLADLYVQMRDVVLGQSLQEGFEPGERITMPELRMAQMLAERIPLDVAAVYLRVGDLEGAARRVGELGDRGGIEWRLRRLIEEAGQANEDGAEALGELAGGFERARPDVSLALCRVGHRLHPQDARFPLCLARLHVELGQPSDATAWYADAIRLAPTEREVYDEALGRLAQMIEGGLFSADESDIGRIRAIGRHAEEILAQRETRWPTEEATVSRAALHYHLGRAELQAGQVNEAARHFERSLEAQRTREALLELATLRARTGDPAGAVALYQEALDRLAQQGPEAMLQRAMLLEHLGDALRASGRADEAQRAYAQALELMTPLAGQGDEERQALTRVRLGVLQRRVGQGERASDEFRAALETAPSWREPYTEILAHLVVTEPAPELAEEVFRRATTGLALEHEWRVYYALWVQAVAGRASQPLSDDVVRTLSGESEEPGWHGRLAAFAAGTIEYDQLLQAAQNPGQRCEAHFYAGTRKLAQGDTAGAREQFRAAMETGMVGYFEYAMAQELLASLGTSERAMEGESRAR
ncbi:TPR domain protein, putative component of TonB system [Sandaracinus amylolyticus]|uniref:TPR domain protein, putative component of TonB system n=2 Tax=Sandaracinus amylolyticus TaxID=927083 RepID=A0A0F6W834_9BACT|nr:TPR domain protein, putative component of TonB system [Sandaracinus amylolyticus]